MSAPHIVSGPSAETSPAGALEFNIGHLIRRAQQLHTAIWSAEFGGDLTGPQFAVLATLLRSGRLNQRAVCQAASLDKSTASDVVARLQRNGWIERVRDPSDGRSDLLTLTPAARAGVPLVSVAARQVQRRLVRALSPTDREALTALLSTVAYAGSPVESLGAAAHPEALRLEVTVGHLVRRVEQLYATCWQRRAQARVTLSQFELITVVGNHGTIDQRSATESTSLDRSTATGVIARLVAKGWLMRAVSTQDRRRKTLQLTAEGGDLLRRLEPVVADAQRDALQPLTAPEAERLRLLLRDLLDR